jgi:hypothetical protein
LDGVRRPSPQPAWFDIAEADQDNRRDDNVDCAFVAGASLRHTPLNSNCLQPLTLRHQLSKMILVLCLTSFTGSLTGGCGAASADAQAQDDVAKARVAAARGDEGVAQAVQILQDAAKQTDTSDTVSAQTKAALGEAQYNAAMGALQTVDANAVKAARLTLEIGSLARQLSVGGALIDGYRKSDPKPVRASIDQKIAEAQGGPDKPAWFTSDKSQIPTLSAVTQNISRLQGTITQMQGQIKQLDDQRNALLIQADEAAKASAKQTGQQAVDSYKKSSDLRKQAADLATQTETLKARIVPMEKDLAVAQGQQAVLNNAIAEFKKQADLLDQHWKTVQTQIAAQQELAKQIASGAGASAPSTQGAEGSETAGKSIAEKAAALKQLVSDSDKLRDAAIDNLTAASSSFDQAFTTAQTARTQLGQMAQNEAIKLNSEASFKAQMDATNPMFYKLRRAAAEQAIGDALVKHAAGLTSRVNVSELLAAAVAATGVEAPKELLDTNLPKQQREAVERADAAYTAAEGLLLDIIDSARQTTELEKQTVKAAQIAQIFARWGHMQTALLAGNVDKAREFEQHAEESVKAAAQIEGARLPLLPGNLAAALPGPAAPSTQPSTAPSDTTPAAPATQPGA